MKRIFSAMAGLAALAACNNSEPAGGRGPFDPLPRYPAPATLGGLPPRLGQTVPAQTQQQAAISIPGETQVTGALPGPPRSAIAPPPTDPNSILAQDVTAALANTAPAAAPAATGEGTEVATADSPPSVPGAAEIGIDPNDESINLALSSQEVQERQRAAAQQRREAAQQQLVIVEPEAVPQQNINANVVAFARQTSHPVGTRTYNRPAFRSRSQAAAVCRRFETEDEAQRQFLANGGPTTDRYNLDPDGDGFACKFDPEKYRSLKF